MINMSIVDSVKNYLLGSYAEMKKVNWPSKKQTINYSTLVIGMSLGMAVFFALLDYAFSSGINVLITR
jgi:preprotein translocase subunit SecE